MKGSEEQLLQFMDGHDKRFVIPVYQRNYDWKIGNCRKLYDDLVKVVKNNRNTHFFGSIVYVYDSESDSSKHEHLIIDGQQRLTTISLLLLAIYNLLEAGYIKSQDNNLRDKIYEVYLVDKYEPEETRIKLKPVKNDNEAFHKLFGSSDGFYKNSNLTINYEYFYNRIQKEEITVDELFKAISKLQIISIRLNEDENPQLIFESLNSTGLDLTEGDKIRNYVLMGQVKKKQNEFYEKYWNPIEIATDYDVSTFIRDYLSLKTCNTPSINSVYDYFKKYVQENNIEIEKLLQDLFLYAKYYGILLHGKSSYNDLAEKISQTLKYTIKRLNWLETTITRPFLLEVLRIYFDNDLSQKDMEEAFVITENYIFRRNICEVATNSLNKIFLNLNKEIVRLEGNLDNYIEKMKYILASKKESGRFPDDSEFTEALSEKSIYNMRNKYRTYILERFENYGTKEVKNVYKAVENGIYSIEHIMPQHLTPAWQDELGVDYQRVHESWLHRLANLTLTAYNSNYSNESFTVKKNLTDKETGEGIGFSNSGLRMNQWIGLKEKWTEEELKERNGLLLDRAKTIWSYVVTDYKPVEKPLDNVTLDDDVILTGRAIAKFSYKGLEQPVSTWVEAYQKILKILHHQDESVLTNLAYETNAEVELASHVSTNPEELGHCEEIDDGIYVWTGISTQYKISNLQKFFKLFGEEPQDLIFYLKDETKENTEKSESPRFELRKRYWTFALPEIKAVNEGKCFTNVNPGTDNWLSGFMGISGFTINCVANYDRAKVEFYLSKSDVNINKEAFDILFSHKDEVEAKIGELVWDRGDNTRYARVMKEITDVSITNEADWKMMAKFHAEWSKKLYDNLLPYIKDKYTK